MADERGDSRVSSFLVGFLVGSLFAGGGTSVYWVWQEHRLVIMAEQRAAEAAVLRARTAVAQAEAEAAREIALVERERAEEALKKAKEK
jgi:hypothetical protein